MKRTAVFSVLAALFLICVVPVSALSGSTGGGAADTWKRYFDRSIHKGSGFEDSAVDGRGNVTAVGWSTNGAGNADVCVAKYDSSGTLLWSYFYDSGLGDDGAHAVTLDDDGSAFVCGYAAAAASSDMFVVGLSPGGAVLPGWPRTYDRSGGQDSGAGIAVDAGGQVVIAGSSSSAVKKDMTIWKYSRTGAAAGGWPKFYDRAGASGDASGLGLAVDAGGDYVVNGYGSGVGAWDAHVWRVSSAGVLSPGWPKNYAIGGNNVMWLSANVDRNGNYAVTGLAARTSLPVDENGDLIMAWYTPDGQLVSPPGIKRYAGMMALTERPLKCAVDAANCLLVPETSIVGGKRTGFLFKFHDDGTVVPGWPRSVQGMDTSEPVGVSLDRDGYLYMTAEVLRGGSVTVLNGMLHKQLNTTPWFLAEGSTGGDATGSFETYVLVQNAGGHKAVADVTYQTPGGQVPGPELVLEPGTRQTVNVGSTVPGEWSVSTMVTSDNPVQCERAVYWNAAGTYRQAATDSIGITRPSETWYLAEGSTGADARGSFETWVLVQNPGLAAADVKVEYMTPEGTVAGPALTLQPGTRQTIPVSSTVPGQWSVSSMVKSDKPIVAERSMYWNAPGTYRQAATDSIGTSSLSKTWYLAEGSTGTSAIGGFETWVLVQNPGDFTAEIKLTYQTPHGEMTGQAISLAAGRRQSVNVADMAPGEWSVSTRVESDLPIVAERSVYWSTPGVFSQAATDSIGAPVACDTWYLPEGSTGSDASGSFETWVLVQNPGTEIATAALTYQTPAGQVAGPTLTLQPGTRQTVSVAATVPSEWSVSTRVESDRPVIAERSMYWNAAGTYRRAATDSIGIDP